MPQMQQDTDTDFLLQQDGVPLPFHREVTSYLIRTVVAWIECGGMIASPPWSPDLTSLDFPVWGYIKEKIFVPPHPASKEGLWARITEAVATTDADMIHRYGTKSLTDGTSATWYEETTLKACKYLRIKLKNIFCILRYTSWYCNFTTFCVIRP